MKVLEEEVELQKSGGEAVPLSGLAPEVIGLYFSAHWCPPCRHFTPNLAGTYRHLSGAKSLEIVFVSSDRTPEEFSAYFAQMPWLAVPFGERSLARRLALRHGILGIPALILVHGPTGELISKNGRSILERDPEGRGFPWAHSDRERYERQIRASNMVFYFIHGPSSLLILVLGIWHQGNRCDAALAEVMMTTGALVLGASAFNFLKTTRQCKQMMLNQILSETAHARACGSIVGCLVCLWGPLTLCAVVWLEVLVWSTDPTRCDPGDEWKILDTFHLSILAAPRPCRNNTRSKRYSYGRQESCGSDISVCVVSSIAVRPQGCTRRAGASLCGTSSGSAYTCRSRRGGVSVWREISKMPSPARCACGNTRWSRVKGVR